MKIPKFLFLNLHKRWIKQLDIEEKNFLEYCSEFFGYKIELKKNKKGISFFVIDDVKDNKKFEKHIKEFFKENPDKLLKVL